MLNELFSLFIMIAALIILFLVVKLLVILIPAAIVALIIWFLTRNAVYSAIGFLIVILISIFKSK